MGANTGLPQQLRDVMAGSAEKGEVAVLSYDAVQLINTAECQS